MKPEQEYLARWTNNGEEKVTEAIALNALVDCLRDHDEFVKETLDQLSVLSKQSIMIMTKLNELLKDQQPSSDSDQSSSSELSFPS